MILTDSAPNWGTQRYFRIKLWPKKVMAPSLKHFSTRLAHMSLDPHNRDIWLGMFEISAAKRRKRKFIVVMWKLWLSQVFLHKLVPFLPVWGKSRPNSQTFSHQSKKFPSTKLCINLQRKESFGRIILVVFRNCGFTRNQKWLLLAISNSLLKGCFQIQILGYLLP